MMHSSLLKRLAASFTTALIAAAILAPLPAHAYRNGCTIYEHRNMKGQFLIMLDSDVVIGEAHEVYRFLWTGKDVRLVGSKWWNKKLSSSSSGKGCWVELYRPNKKSFLMGRYDLDARSVDEWNDKATAIRCRCDSAARERLPRY